jgi:hypothetical protein
MMNYELFKSLTLPRPSQENLGHLMAFQLTKSGNFCLFGWRYYYFGSSSLMLSPSDWVQEDSDGEGEQIRNDNCVQGKEYSEYEWMYMICHEYTGRKLARSPWFVRDIWCLVSEIGKQVERRDKGWYSGPWSQKIIWDEWPPHTICWNRHLR